ncbi:class I SAM-dependent methyltransferase [Pseudoduganella aquatica]|uniref:S-adenosyl-L-methionine-dependent methyltransferase n=1 Tax=Pseudoduganella aquatica TaxID=2660641 RepID=A0A7X4HE12_9BURK|nr:class I SAM-dependent methyltransferase [Pseudoduganella aquatica]MYN09450.1 SAM-dependent methyltransferase [Pseudoduganella aquatica]
MQHDSPKPSAMMVAVLRGAHQLLDAPLILDDPLALPILGAEREAEVRANPERFHDPLATALRTTIVIRSRLAEDTWREAQQRGVMQHVILGAGLDTSAYRGKLPAGVRVFEVDLPATQQWKRERLAAAGIAAPDTVRYAAVDFGTTTLADGLAQAGFDHSAPACFTWLGVTLYLAPEDVAHTLRYIASCAQGSSVVFDFVISPALLEPRERAAMEAISASLATGGEPWKSNFAPAELEALLRSMGYSRIEHYGREELTQRHLRGRSDNLRLGGSTGIIRATLGADAAAEPTQADDGAAVRANKAAAP